MYFLHWPFSFDKPCDLGANAHRIYHQGFICRTYSFMSHRNYTTTPHYGGASIELA